VFVVVVEGGGEGGRIAQVVMGGKGRENLKVEGVCLCLGR
jgi:hypothetical protein